MPYGILWPSGRHRFKLGEEEIVVGPAAVAKLLAPCSRPLAAEEPVPNQVQCRSPVMSTLARSILARWSTPEPDKPPRPGVKSPYLAGGT